MRIMGKFGLVAAACCLLAADNAAVNVGDKAPTFSSTDDQGKTWNSADHVGKKVVVVYFFPAAMTGG